MNIKKFWIFAALLVIFSIVAAQSPTATAAAPVNADKMKVTGRKAETKEYDYYTRYIAGHKFVSFKDMMVRKPEKVVEMAVKRMLPKSKLGREMFRMLKVYRGPEHAHAAQQPEKIEL